MIKEKKEGIVNVLVTHRGVQKLEVTFCDLRKTNKIKKGIFFNRQISDALELFEGGVVFPQSNRIYCNI